MYASNGFRTNDVFMLLAEKSVYLRLTGKKFILVHVYIYRFCSIA